MRMLCAEGFAARAVYKLEEIDKKHRLFKPGVRVLDLGCRPGSWLQYVSRTAPGARLVGVDRQPLDVAIPGATVLVADIFDLSLEQLKNGLAGFDVVLSDMAPDTSGVRAMDQARSETLFEQALGLAETLLVPGGHFVGKLFQGPDWQRLLGRVRASFTECKTVKPDSSRKESIEQFVVGLKRR